MSNQWPGGVISKTPPTVSTSAASGVWTLSQQAGYQKLGQWPSPPFPISASITFSSAGTFGRTGPSQATLTSYYTGLGGDWTAVISYYTQIRGTGYQQFTIPVTGTYQFEVYGAVGSRAIDNASWTAGQAARITVSVALTAGDVLQIIVGQGPGTSESNNGGGGGGTFVLKNNLFSSLSDADIICIAGGSAGGAYNVAGPACTNASLTSTANTPVSIRGATSGTGGGGGNGAGYGGNSGAAVPAAGLYSNATNTLYQGSSVASTYIAQNSGAVGGLGFYSSTPSGFGGAGGSGNHAGGTGGGYNGGGPGSGNAESSAGGSSYFSAAGVTFVSSALWGTTNTTTGANGSVVLTRTA